MCFNQHLKISVHALKYDKRLYIIFYFILLYILMIILYLKVKHFFLIITKIHLRDLLFHYLYIFFIFFYFEKDIFNKYLLRPGQVVTCVIIKYIYYLFILLYKTMFVCLFIYLFLFVCKFLFCFEAHIQYNLYVKLHSLKFCFFAILQPVFI